MHLTAEQRLKQARVKYRLIAAREYRQWKNGEIDYLPGCIDQRIVLDAIENAYKAGERAATQYNQ